MTSLRCGCWVCWTHGVAPPVRASDRDGRPGRAPPGRRVPGRARGAGRRRGARPAARRWVAVERPAVQPSPTARTGGRRLLDAVGADGRLAVPGGLDDELAAVDPQRGAGEGRRVDQEQALPGDREQPERGPDVPGAEAARVVVARQAARAGAELPGQRGVHDLGGAVRAAGVVVGPRRLHVRLVVQPLEPVERVAGGHLRGDGRPPGLGDRRPRRSRRSGRACRRTASSPPASAIRARHVVQQPERVVPLAALVELESRSRPVAGSKALTHAGCAPSSSSASRLSPSAPGHLGRAVVAVGEVEGVRDRVDDAVLEEVLAVDAAQVVVHVHERPAPVQAGEPERVRVGQRGVGQRAGLPEEPVGAAGHPVADREVALLLADPDQRLQQVDGPVRGDRHQQRELGLVDVPHRADVERERSRRRPERALVVAEARLDQRVVERGGEHRAPRRRAALDLDAAEVVVPAGLGPGPDGVERRLGAVAALAAQVLPRLLAAAQREPDPHLDGLAGPRPGP